MWPVAIVGGLAFLIWRIMEANSALAQERSEVPIAPRDPPPPGIDAEQPKPIPSGTLPGPHVDAMRQAVISLGGLTAAEYAGAAGGRMEVQNAAEGRSSAWIARMFGRPSATGNVGLSGGMIANASAGSPAAEMPVPERPVVVQASFANQRYVPPYVE